MRESGTAVDAPAIQPAFFHGVADLTRYKASHVMRIKGELWLRQVFDKAILLEPEGVVIRKASAVARMASEAALRDMAKALGFLVSRLGTHFLIHRPGVTFTTLP